MNKGDLIDQLYEENNLTKRECREAIDTVVDAITEAVAEGEEVRLVDFGTFKPSPRKETVKRHPQTGEEIEVPAKVVPKFSPGKGFREATNNDLEVAKDSSGDLGIKKT